VKWEVNCDCCDFLIFDCSLDKDTGTFDQGVACILRASDETYYKYIKCETKSDLPTDFTCDPHEEVISLSITLISAETVGKFVIMDLDLSNACFPLLWEHRCRIRVCIIPSSITEWYSFIFRHQPILLSLRSQTGFELRWVALGSSKS